MIKVYDIPIFYFPKLSHPDPTVERRSGFLTPSFTDSKNLGWYSCLIFLILQDKNFTLTSKFLHLKILYLSVSIIKLLKILLCLLILDIPKVIKKLKYQKKWRQISFFLNILKILQVKITHRIL